METEQERPLEQPVTDDKPTDETPSSDGPSMEDTIRDEYRRLTSSENADTGDDTTAAAPARARSPDGKFAKATTDEASATAKVEDTPPMTAAAPPAATDDYPKTWRKEARGEWAGVSPAIKAEIKRREENFFEGIRQYQEPAAFGRAIGQEMLPHVEMMRQVGITPQQLTREMMSTWAALATGQPDQKRQVLLNIARQYGIDIAASSATSSTGEATTQAVSPDLSPVLQRVQSIEQIVRQQAAQAAQIASENATSEVARFASNAERKHFAAVQETMAQLIGSGQATTLDEAYDKAVWMVPDVREQLLAEQAQKRSQDDAAKAAAARKAASTNVARRGTTPTAPKRGSMEDTIRDEYRRLMSS